MTAGVAAEMGDKSVKYSGANTATALSLAVMAIYTVTSDGYPNGEHDANNKLEQQSNGQHWNLHQHRPVQTVIVTSTTKAHLFRKQQLARSSQLPHSPTHSCRRKALMMSDTMNARESAIINPNRVMVPSHARFPLGAMMHGPDSLFGSLLHSA